MVQDCALQSLVTFQLLKSVLGVRYEKVYENRHGKFRDRTIDCSQEFLLEAHIYLDSALHSKILARLEIYPNRPARQNLRERRLVATSDIDGQSTSQYATYRLIVSSCLVSGINSCMSGVNRQNARSARQETTDTSQVRQAAEGAQTSRCAEVCAQVAL